MEKFLRMLVVGTENTSKEKILLESIRSILLKLYSKGFVHTGINDKSDQIYDLVIIYEKLADENFISRLNKHLSQKSKVIILSEKSPERDHPSMEDRNLDVSHYWICWAIFTRFWSISRYLDNICVPWVSA